MSLYNVTSNYWGSVENVPFTGHLRNIDTNKTNNLFYVRY